MIKTKFICYVIIVLFVASIGFGCVTRSINIKTTPSNASVYIDDKYVGESPVSVPFTFYGSRKILIEKLNDDGKLLLKRKIIYEDIKAPFYEMFPIDFFSEMVLPLKLEDNHHFDYELEPLVEVSIEERKKQLLLNSEELRKKTLEIE